MGLSQLIYKVGVTWHTPHHKTCKKSTDPSLPCLGYHKGTLHVMAGESD